MRILIVTQYFTPEVTAASLRLEPLAAGLAARGHTVEVLCEAPAHPHGIVPSEFRRALYRRRGGDGYRATHVWVTSSASKRARTRLASYASYAATGLAVGATMRRPDVVLASSPPLSVGALGLLLARRHRAPLVFDVRDLWPEVAVELGELEPGRVLSAAERLERNLYRAATAITTPTEPFARHIASFGDYADKIHVLANGTTREWLGSAGAPAEKARWDLPEDRFVWTYAGNVGLSQRIEVAIEAAELLGDSFQLLILGDGTAKPALQELARAVPAGRVVFRSSVPPADARSIMRSSDALAVLLGGGPALDKTIPVKLYDSCAVGRPVVLAAEGESRRVAELAGAALTLDPGNAETLAEAVRSLRDDAALRERLLAGATRFAEQNLRENGVEVLERILAGATPAAGRKGRGR